MINSALRAQGLTKIGINNATPQAELDVNGSVKASGNIQSDMLWTRNLQLGVGTNNGLHFGLTNSQNNWAAILVTETPTKRNFGLSVGGGTNDTLTLASSGEVGIQGTVRAFGVDSLLWTGTAFENGGKTFTAPTDGFITLHAFNIMAGYSVADSAGAQLHGAMLYCRGSEPGNVAVITLPLAKGDSIHYEKQANGSGSWNAWMRWRPLGR